MTYNYSITNQLPKHLDEDTLALKSYRHQLTLANLRALARSI